MTARSYQFNPELRIWETAAYPGSTYSDGEEIEQRLLESLRTCTDVSVLSDELRLHISDWPSEYHFSPERSNLLRPLGFGATDYILELGCGCGALTRYLGETGATVIAVEGSKRRATIAAERCRDLPNVKVYCDNLQHFHIDQRFSHVTLIGVMEYARLFIAGENPELLCLQSAACHLADEGQLVLAIENQFGLKYFNGCSEDHLGILGYGIHDLYTSATPVTFGRHELQSLLVQAGFNEQEWIYPFPDYKLPTHVIHTAALSQPEFNVGDLLHNTCARDYTGRIARAFHEGMVWRGLARNQLLPDLANSFLVSAGRTKTRAPQRSWLAVSFSTNRRAAYCTQTIFVANACSTVEVHKKILGAEPEPPTSILQLRHTPRSVASYVFGKLHAVEFQHQAARARSMDDFLPWLQQWLALLRAEQLRVGLEETQLPGELIDAIPSNLVADANGNLQLIDFEWHMDGTVPTSWVLIRGMVMSLAAAPPIALWRDLSFQQATTLVLQIAGIELDDADFEQAARMDDALQQEVLSPKMPSVSLKQTLSTSVQSRGGDISTGFGERRLLNELVRVKSTWSWRLTAPLRALANLPRLLFQRSAHFQKR